MPAWHKINKPRFWPVSKFSSAGNKIIASCPSTAGSPPAPSAAAPPPAPIAAAPPPAPSAAGSPPAPIAAGPPLVPSAAGSPPALSSYQQAIPLVASAPLPLPPPPPAAAETSHQPVAATRAILTAACGVAP
jgi:hypothetical protein